MEKSGESLKARDVSEGESDLSRTGYLLLPLNAQLDGRLRYEKHALCHRILGFGFIQDRGSRGSQNRWRDAAQSICFREGRRPDRY